jgi:hypothetical protein
MTESQRELGRHALGLPNKQRTTYRNHFCAGQGHTDYLDWMAMVSEGNAVRADGTPLSGGDDVFSLTIQGARLCLNPNEHLDRDYIWPRG